MFCVVQNRYAKETHSKAEGYITAADAAEDHPYGYVFLDRRITTGPDVEKGIYLGRSWRPYAAMAFIRCDPQARLRDGVRHNWGKESNEKTARYVEYGSTGPGAEGHRVLRARLLTAAEAAKYTVGNILGGDDGCAPEK